MVGKRSPGDERAMLPKGRSDGPQILQLCSSHTARTPRSRLGAIGRPQPTISGSKHALYRSSEVMGNLPPRLIADDHYPASLMPGKWEDASGQLPEANGPYEGDDRT